MAVKKITPVVETPAPKPPQIDFDSLSLEDINKLRERLSQRADAIYDEKRKQERLADRKKREDLLKSKSAVVNRLKKRLEALRAEYATFVELNEEIDFTLNFKLDVTLDTEYEDLIDVEYADMAELFTYDVSSNLATKMSKDDRRTIEEVSGPVFEDICSDGFRIVAPELGKRVDTFVSKYDKLLTDLKNEGLSIDDLVDVEEDEE